MDRLQKFFWEVYLRNCEIEAVEPDEDDLEKIKFMDRDKLYKNFRYLVNNLLDFKNKVKNSDVKEMAQRSIELETIIAKLEAKNRAFIAEHFQLKVDIESLQKLVDEQNNQITKDKSEIKELKNLVFDLKTNESQKRFTNGDKRMILNIDQIAKNQKSMTFKAIGKGLTERTVQRNSGRLQGSRSVAPSQDPAHSRSKSESSKTLKIIIP